MRETLQWREEFGIEKVTIDEIKDEMTTGKIYIHGTDKSGRPVMYQVGVLVWLAEWCVLSVCGEIMAMACRTEGNASAN